MRKILLLLGLLVAAGQVWADALPRCKTRHIGARVEKSPTPLLTPDTISYFERTPDGGIVYCQPPEDLKHPDGKYHWCNDTLVEPSVKNCNDVPKPPEDEDKRPKEGGKDGGKEVPGQIPEEKHNDYYVIKVREWQINTPGNYTERFIVVRKDSENCGHGLKYQSSYRDGKRYLPLKVCGQEIAPKNKGDNDYMNVTVVTATREDIKRHNEGRQQDKPKPPEKPPERLPGDSHGINPGGGKTPEPSKPGSGGSGNSGSGDTGGSDSGSAGGGNSAGGGGGGNGSSGSGGGSGGGSGSGKGNGEGEGEQSAFCRKFPNTVACMQPGNGEVDPFKVPGGGGGGGKTDGGIGWRPDFFLPSGNTCPADKVITVMGKPITFSYEGFCLFLDRINPLVRASCMFIAGMLVIRSIKGK